MWGGIVSGPTNAGSRVRLDIPEVGTGARSEQSAACLANDLNTAAPPARIDRQFFANNAGTVGDNMLDEVNPDYRGRIPHRPIRRAAIMPTTHGKTVDFAVTVPAVYVGNPLG